MARESFAKISIWLSVAILGGGFAVLAGCAPLPVAQLREGPGPALLSHQAAKPQASASSFERQPVVRGQGPAGG